MRPIPTTTALLFALVLAGEAGEVTLSQDARAFRLANGRLSVGIEKATGRIAAATLDGKNLLENGGGYWSLSASSGRARVSGFGAAREHAVTLDPAANGGARAEVACRFRGTGEDGSFPGRVELRYALAKDSTTLHVAAVLDHGAGDAPFGLGEGRFVLKLDRRVFNHLSIDRQRDRNMPSGEDWDRGTTLNLSEVRRLTTGKWAGSVEHKYGYSAILADLPAYGWCGTGESFGVWLINPSHEYLAGGPTKMELTGHLDVGAGGRPTLLNMWHGSHYGGTVLRLEQDEKWTKVIGPFGLHFNSGGTPAELWKKANLQADAERAAWPYAWFDHAAYPLDSARGGVAGRIRLAAGTPPRTIRVGLTAPDYSSPTGRGGGETIGWQRDAKHYQYWTRTGSDGTFTLPGVRPGTYMLRAFADGVWGEMEQARVTVRAGALTALGEVVWTPVAAGPVLWQIGVPDRSAAEFRNGDRYWAWGNYFRYARDFPAGVNYTVGKSDWRRDWHLCQPLALSPEGKVLGPTAWTVRFPLEKIPAGGAVLRVGFCGSRARAKWSVTCNGQLLAPPESMPENGVMHRDSHRGMWFDRVFPIPAERLRTGENLMRFQLSGSTWHQGVLYDCIRLEAVAAPSATTLQP